jgi:hypothetical protein
MAPKVKNAKNSKLPKMSESCFEPVGKGGWPDRVVLFLNSIVPPGVVTFVYDLHFRRLIAHWKGIVEDIHYGGSIIPLSIIEELDTEKPSFRPSKWPRK